MSNITLHHQTITYHPTGWKEIKKHCAAKKYDSAIESLRRAALNQLSKIDDEYKNYNGLYFALWGRDISIALHVRYEPTTKAIVSEDSFIVLDQDIVGEGTSSEHRRFSLPTNNFLSTCATFISKRCIKLPRNAALYNKEHLKEIQAPAPPVSIEDLVDVFYVKTFKEDCVAERIGEGSIVERAKQKEIFFNSFSPKYQDILKQHINEKNIDKTIEAYGKFCEMSTKERADREKWYRQGKSAFMRIVAILIAGLPIIVAADHNYSFYWTIPFYLLSLLSIFPIWRAHAEIPRYNATIKGERLQHDFLFELAEGYLSYSRKGIIAKYCRDALVLGGLIGGFSVLSILAWNDALPWGWLTQTIGVLSLVIPVGIVFIGRCYS